MISFKGILKYSIYLFIAGWMFLLGIMVGRGNSPVTFDTRKFQTRLETIAKEFGEKKEQREQVELKFYEALEKPVPVEENTSRQKIEEIVPKRIEEGPAGEAAVKTSLKKQTFNKGAVQAVSAAEKTKAPIAEKKIPPVKAPETSKKDIAPPPGKYTLQVAAYKNFKDAVTQMAALEKKGFSSYRVRGEKNGVTWYRVRSGSFATFDQAKIYKEKLKKAKIDSIILKKAENENN